jgi:hypothetical protein
MPVEADVRFLNIDLLLVGRFDRKPLLAAMGDDVFVLHDGAKVENEKCLMVEVLAPGLDLAGTLARLMKWVQELPTPARRSWAAASRRVFDIGIQAGLKPHDTHWAISQEQVAALAKLGAGVTVTVYGAEWRRRAAPSSQRGAARARRPRRS